MHKFISAIAIFALALGQAASAHEPSPTALPVGDGKVTDHPAAGNVYACNMNFRTGGARHVGAWFKGSTWNPLEKPRVKGEIMWPQAAFAMTPQDVRIRVESNGLPVGQPTGEFPISPTDPAYQYDTNPNPIAAQKLDFNIPQTPQRAAEPGCLPMGMIGFSTTGVAFYNALDDAGNDAAAHEVQDLCNGHPQGKGQYHYHSSSPCLPGADASKVVGWALDGYPILGMREADGSRITNADLDACHGRAEDLKIDGRSYTYAYRLTMEYPYVLGCYTGQVAPETRQSIREAMGPLRQQGRRGPAGQADRAKRPPRLID